MTITTGLPRANGQIERLNRTIVSVLAKLTIDDPSKWYKHIGKLQRILNATYHRSIGMTPFQLLFGTEMRDEIDLQLKALVEEEFQSHFEENRDDLRKKAKEQISKVQEENRRTYNLRRKNAPKYKEGDLVAIKRTQVGPVRKLRAKYLGPYIITKAKLNDT